MDGVNVRTDDRQHPNFEFEGRIWENERHAAHILRAIAPRFPLC